MKSIVLHEIVNKKYFLAKLPSYSWRYTPMSIEDRDDEEGFVAYKLDHVEWVTILETKDFIRELKEEESIHIEDKDYKINKVSHSANGEILYYLNKQIINEDLDSKKNAELDSLARKQFLLDRLLRKTKDRIDVYRCDPRFNDEKVEPRGFWEIIFGK